MFAGNTNEREEFSFAKPEFDPVHWILRQPKHTLKKQKQNSQ